MATTSSLIPTSISSTSSSALSASGLISGLDTKSIIDGLVALDQNKITAIQTKKAIVTAQQTAFNGVEARLLSLQGQITQFARSQNGIFAARTATSSVTDIVSAAASSSATAGVYQLRVNSLAKAHQVASQGYNNVSSTITHGTVQITSGDKAVTITVDSTNDTLQGLANAINNSGANVVASIINDGFGEDRQGYRLILAAKSTGTANSISIVNNLAASASGATRPVFDAGSISAAIAGKTNSSAAIAQSNAGAAYTGTTNNIYTFTVATGGTVGTDNGITLSYTDSTGANTGTITLNQADVGVQKTAAQGIGIQFSAGTLVAGDTFQIKAFVPTLQAATDASLTLGSGPGALTVTSSNNKIDSVIPGVTLQLTSADPARDVSITVANDTEKAQAAIEDFVKSYNDLMKYIDEQSSFNTTTNAAGPLLGNSALLQVQNQVRFSLTGAVGGVNPRMSHLGALGITADKDGQLQIDGAKLSAALNGGVTGVTLDDVRKLFALSGSSNNTNIQFVTGSAKTKATSTPYTVQITQAAERAALTSTTALSASTIITSSNNTLTVSIDGKTSSTLTLAAGTYTQAALAQAVQSAINGDANHPGANVNVAVAGNLLTISSSLYGTGSQVVVQSGTALATLGYSAGAAVSGRDVVGNFLVNGVAEPAVGTGQFLSGDPANANTSGLQVRVLLTPAQVGTGATAEVSVTRGVASQLDRQLANLFDPFNGRLKTIDDAFDAALERLANQEATENKRIAARRASLTKQFANMEQALSQLQSTSNYLAQQLVAAQSSK
jgi:flagellar hook-associated protein 2